MQFKPRTYLAFVLSDETRSSLISQFPPSFDKIACHHVTFEFNLTQDRLDEITNGMLTGLTIYANDLVTGSSIECFTVTVNGKTDRKFGGRYHLTHSYQPPAKPVDSNALLERGVGAVHTKIVPIRLQGELKLVQK